MIDAFSTLTGETPPPPLSTDAPDVTIQITNADKAPKKVTTYYLTFPLFIESKNKHSFSLLLGSKKGSNN